MQKIIQIHPCLLKVSCKQESVTDGQTDRRTAAITISPTAIAGDNKSYKAQISEALGISYMHKAT